MWPKVKNIAKKIVKIEKFKEIGKDSQKIKLIEVIKDKYNWALEINVKKTNENYFFWYTSQSKLEPRLGITDKDHGIEKQLPFDIPKQVQNALKIFPNINIIFDS